MTDMPSRCRSESGCRQSNCPFIHRATGSPNLNEADQHMFTGAICQDYPVHACDRALCEYSHDVQHLRDFRHELYCDSEDFAFTSARTPYQSTSTEVQRDSIPREYIGIDVLCILLNNYTPPTKKARAKILPADFDGIGQNFLLAFGEGCQLRFLKKAVVERYEEPILNWNARHVLRKKLAALGFDGYAQETPGSEMELLKLVRQLWTSPYYNYRLLLSDYDINNRPGLVELLSLTVANNMAMADQIVKEVDIGILALQIASWVATARYQPKSTKYDSITRR
ncbi:hypothetical protein DL95DRAFT_404571 [Leptodontidium sp. 2 PMI_412]|nr:hypothetical protein DL95DRAFT_404571 [Leptodontidium sp. 2 PMI_412]